MTASRNWIATVIAFFALAADLLRPAGRIGFLVTVLLVSLLGISAVATGIGILHLAQIEATGQGLLGMALVLIGTSVITVLMWVMLERSRLPGSTLARSMCGVFYGFLFLWAVGFGYGFWWEAIASRQASIGGIEKSLADLRDGLLETSTQLTVADNRMSSLIEASRLRAEREDTEGNSCGAPSGVGRGALWGARSRVNDEIVSKAAELRNGWLGPARTRLGQARSSIAGFDPPAGVAARQAAFTTIYENARDSADEINKIGASAGAPLASDLKDIARRLRIEPGKAEFQCYDPALATFLENTAAIVGKPARLKIAEWTSVEGSDSTEEAFLKLWGTMSGALGTNVTGKTMVGRDWIALLAAIAVDIGILVLTLVRPRAGGKTFMGDEQADGEALGQLERSLHRHHDAAHLIFYDLHFSMGRRQYITIPDIQWTGPAGASPRDFHVALGALAPRLAASRLTNPSTRLLAAAIGRLNRVGWSLPEQEPAEERDGDWRAWFDGIVRGSVLPDHPLIFEIAEQDRNLAIRLLDDAQDGERGKRRTRGLRERLAATESITEPTVEPTPAPKAAPKAAPSPDPAPGPGDPAPIVDTGLIQRIYAAAVSQRARGLAGEADGLLHILRSMLPGLKDQGIDVIGLDDVVGKPYDPSSPFLVLNQVASDEPKGMVLEVTALAIARRTPKGRTVREDGHVIVSAGRAAPGAEAEPARLEGAPQTHDVLLDPQAWMPGGGEE